VAPSERTILQGILPFNQTLLLRQLLLFAFSGQKTGLILSGRFRRWFFCGRREKPMWEVRSQRGKAVSSPGYSGIAQCTGTRSYLEPNSGSLQKPIEGVYSLLEKIEDRSRIGEKTAQNHVETAVRAYLEPIRNRMHEPIEGLSRQFCRGFIKGRGSQTESNRAQQHQATQNHKKVHTALHGNTKHP